MALLIRKYSLLAFSRMMDISRETISELKMLHHLGFDYISIRIEGVDDETLARMDKECALEDIVQQPKVKVEMIFLAFISGKWH